MRFSAAISSVTLLAMSVPVMSDRRGFQSNNGRGGINRGNQGGNRGGNQFGRRPVTRADNLKKRCQKNVGENGRKELQPGKKERVEAKARRERKSFKKAKTKTEADATRVEGACVAQHVCASVRGDPHITTFDGLKYDCQVSLQAGISPCVRCQLFWNSTNTLVSFM